MTGVAARLEERMGYDYSSHDNDEQGKQSLEHDAVQRLGLSGSVDEVLPPLCRRLASSERFAMHLS